jgi:hypothetical protein
MSGILVAGMLALASPSAQPVAPADPPAASFIAARARQTFYPLGRLEGDGMKMAYYLMGGPLSERNQASSRSAVLVNLTADRGLVQVVELQTVSCKSGKLTPTFRMLLDPDGDALPSSGPVDPAAETLLSPDAVRQSVAILCNGAEPADALPGRTVTEVR